MGIFGNPYFQNVASDFIGLAIIALFGVLGYLLSRRRQLLRFFGCSGTRRIHLYLSNLDIVFGGAKDSSGLTRTYHGPSTPGYELPFIPALYRLFMAPVPGVSSQSGFWRYLALREVEVDASPAPRSAQDIDESSTIITVGSIGYNTISKEVERCFEPRIRLDPAGYIILPDGMRYDGADYALVAKCYHSVRKQWAFYVAGPTRIGTTSAFSYLIQHWDDLRKRFGDQSSFCVTIRVIDGDPLRREIVNRYSK